MGSVLGNALIACRVAKPAQLVIYDPAVTKNKLPRGITLVRDEQHVVDTADVVFLGVRPFDMEPLARKLKIKKNTIFISIAAGVPLKTLQRYFGSNVMRIIPSYTQSIGAGPILYSVNKKFSPETVRVGLGILRSIGELEEIPESLLEVASDLTSCAPAFWAYLLHVFVEEAVRRGLSRDTANQIAKSSMSASAQTLLSEKNSIEVVDRVATPGGITREGINVLEREFPRTIKKVFNATQRKYKKLHGLLSR